MEKEIKMFQKIKKLFTKKAVKYKRPIAKWKRPFDWQPKEFTLQKDLPGIRKGARFQQSYQSDNIYFLAIPISGDAPEKDQVGIIQFEAQYVENNLNWFIPYINI